MFQRLTLSIFLVLVVASLSLNAQNINDLIKFEKVQIPFESKNGFIILDVRFNHVFPLKFIFDTGAEHTILTKKHIATTLGLQSVRQYKIIGADMSEELVAHLVTGIHLKMADLTVSKQALLVLNEDYFHFEEFTGVPVHGIIGANFFRNFVVKIDYRRNLITFIRPNTFDGPGRNYKEVPISIEKNKPYVQALVQIGQDKPKIPMKFLLDSGAALTMLMYPNSHPDIVVPDNVINGNIGKGLGGFLKGYMGRATKVEMGDFQFNEVLTNFQDISDGRDTSQLNGRNGIIGNEILNRFTVIIDYPHGKMYLKPNKLYKKRFNYDKSGLIIIAEGVGLNTFKVNDVVENSPAALAGILPGDEIIRVNFWSSKFYDLERLSNKFKGKTGKRMKLTIKRNDQKSKKVFYLKDLI